MCDEPVVEGELLGSDLSTPEASVRGILHELVQASIDSEVARQEVEEAREHLLRVIASIGEDSGLDA